MLDISLHPLLYPICRDMDHNNSYASNSLPTPPSSVPSRSRTNNSHHLALPPITHLQHFNRPCPSPLTPPDDDMNATQIPWRDSKPGPSRLHSPVTAYTSPLSSSPSPSPMDEERDSVSYTEQEDAEVDEDEEDEDEDEDEVEPKAEPEQYHHHHHNNNNSPYTHDAADWVSSTSKRSSLFIAEKTCEMICYLWFSSSLGPSSSRHRSARARRAAAAAASSSSPSSPHYHSLSNSRTAVLQFSASRDFVQFMQKLLETTQVSQSVIVLSIYYIYRLKERNEFSVGQPGSEFRVAVVALMMANKFVDDNTYTNKTWSEVSGISLTELNKMEREFLQGVDFRLFVDESTYESWLNLLRGLVYAKERELQRWNDLSSACVRPLAAAVVAPERRQHTYSSRSRRVRHSRSDSSSYPSQRARSSSPQASHSYPFTFSVPQQAKSDMSHLQSQQQQQQQTLMTSSSACSPSTQAHTATRPGSKRSAEDAFSPTSATFAGVVQTKRPTGLAVDTSVTSSLAAMAGAVVGSSPMVKSAYAAVGGSGVYADSLRGFERLSISSAVRTPASTTSGSSNQSLAQPSGLVAPAPSEYQQQHSESRHSRQSHVLAAPYQLRVDRQTVPDQLYFYALASSPMKGQGQAENVEDDEDVSMESSAQIAGRKGHLRYSRPPAHAQVGQETEPSPYGKRVATSVYSEYYNGGAQSQHQSSYGVVEPSRSASHHHHQVIGHGLPSAFTPGGAPHLPPLTQALSSYAHSQPQSNGQSSFQSGRDLPVPMQQTTPSYPSSVTTQRRFSVVPLMVQSARSSPLSNFSDYGHSHQQQARYAASPVHQYYSQTRHVSQTQGSSLPVESAAPALFANAGPPGIQHFYAPLSSRSNVKYYRQVGSGAGAVQSHYHHYQHHHHHQQQQPMSSPFAIRV